MELTGPRFMHAPHSRAPLKISHDMFCYLITYHPVMPAFLGFVFPFGTREYEHDFHLSGLRIVLITDKMHHKTASWSICQTAVYHLLDLETGNLLRVTVKGNNRIRDRITESLDVSKCAKHERMGKSFSASFRTHSIVCD